MVNRQQPTHKGEKDKHVLVGSHLGRGSIYMAIGIDETELIGGLEHEFYFSIYSPEN